MKENHRLLHNLLLYSVFAVYIAILFAILFMGRRSYRSINFVPFSSVFNYLTSDDKIWRYFAPFNFIGNIVLFVPLGVYLTLLNRSKNMVKNLFLVFLVSLSVEIIQYIFMIGASDIDDIILNCFGGIHRYSSI